MIDLFRIHEQRVASFFRGFFGELIREHEEFSLMGSTYLLIAALLAVEIFPRNVAAAAIGFTVIGDATAAMVGKRVGKAPILQQDARGRGRRPGRLPAVGRGADARAVRCRGGWRWLAR